MDRAEPESEPQPTAKTTSGSRRQGTVAAAVPANAQTSDSHPIRVSWVAGSRQGDDDVVPGGRLGLCFCPGKQIMKSRLRAGHHESGCPIMRDLAQDLQRLHSMGIRQCDAPASGPPPTFATAAATLRLVYTLRHVVNMPLTQLRTQASLLAQRRRAAKPGYQGQLRRGGVSCWDRICSLSDCRRSGCRRSYWYNTSCSRCRR